MMESDDDFCSSDEDYNEESDAAMDFTDGESEDCDDDVIDEKTYTILKEEDILKRQNDDIATVSTILSVSREAAHTLLCRYNWDVNNLQDEWFADEERVRNKVGLPLVEHKDVKLATGGVVFCKICLGSYSPDEMNSAACGHLFCNTCWKTYAVVSVNGGPGSLLLRCPEPKCGVAVGKDMIDVLVPDEEKLKYQRYVMRSYIENNRRIKWCPAPDCECAVEYVVGSSSSGSYDVTCSCSYCFCWNCCEETHRPVDCEKVAKWIFKNKDEEENTNWILANTKPCPNCGRSIEKNKGCMHMTCVPPCKHEFCWLCLGSWREHIGGANIYTSCNKYNASVLEGVDEAERRRKNARQALEKYIHYYERWTANESSRKQACADLQEMQTKHLGRLSEIHYQTDAAMQFIVEAWLQIIECRRVLKWTYAYGYYLPDLESTKKQFFEYLQGEAEANLERLHQCAETDAKKYLDSESATNKDLVELRVKLVDLTSVTRNYFDNLVRALQNDLADVGLGTQSKLITIK